LIPGRPPFFTSDQSIRKTKCFTNFVVNSIDLKYLTTETCFLKADTTLLLKSYGLGGRDSVRLISRVFNALGRRKFAAVRVRGVFTQPDFAVDTITASPATGHQGQNSPASADVPLARAVKGMVGCPVFSLATPVSFIFTFDHPEFLRSRCRRKRRSGKGE
jgi:hypothetical protein